MSPRHSALVALIGSLGITASVLTASTVAGAAVGDLPTQWSAPQVLASGSTTLSVVATDAVGPLAVALVTRDVGQGGGVGGVGTRAGNGTEFDIYTASGEGSWVKRRTLDIDTVGAVAGRPDIATDGFGWAVTWQRGLPTGRYEVVVATSASTNTEPKVSVLSSTYPTGYIGGPEPQIDGAASENALNGPRYLVAWIAKRGAPGAPAPTSTTIETREMFSGREWSAATTVATYGDASAISDLKASYAADRSAIVGYVDRVANERSLTVVSRLVNREWGDAARVINEPISKTTGVWDLDDIPEGQTYVPVAWAISNPPGVRYTRMLLGNNVGFPQDLIRLGAGATYVSSVAVAGRSNDNVIVAWTEQDATAPAAVQGVRLVSYVTTYAQPLADAQSTLFTGQSSGSPVVNVAMNEGGRTWVTLTTAGPAPTAAVRVFEAASAAPADVWTGVVPTTVSGAVPGTLIRGTGLLVSGDTSLYPRVVWAMGAADPFSFMASKQIPIGRAPSAPLNVAARPGDGHALVLWDPPADAGSAPVSGYTVTANPGGATCTTDQRECIVAGLTNGTAYTFTVVARNPIGEGPASAPSAAITPTAAPATGPLPPATLTVKAKPGRKIVVKWTASTSPDVASYVVGISKNGGAWRDRNVGNVLRKVYRVKLNKTFCYRVAAVDGAGAQGDWTAQKCVRGRP